MAKQTGAVLGRVMASLVVCSGEPSARVTGRTWREWFFAGTVLPELVPSSSKSVPERAMAGPRPEVWLANLSCKVQLPTPS